MAGLLRSLRGWLRDLREADARKLADLAGLAVWGVLMAILVFIIIYFLIKIITYSPYPYG